ncbi:MAG TPA: sulfurtransferase complex subunit TusC [Dongiaceae bacterium]|nr:sulfurtransferase complex subunit TusC [Dongiaceae bacterium]
MKSVLFINRQPPHSSLATREALDAALATAAFGVDTALLFLDDGVFQLRRQQQPAAAQLKATAPIFESLDLYGIEQRFVCAESLRLRGLSTDDLIIPVQPLDADGVRALLTRFDHLLSF